MTRSENHEILRRPWRQGLEDLESRYRSVKTGRGLQQAMASERVLEMKADAVAAETAKQSRRVPGRRARRPEGAWQAADRLSRA